MSATSLRQTEDAIRRASEPAVVRDSLAAAREVFDAEAASNKAGAVDSFLDFLLRHVCPNWLSIFSSRERADLFDRFFLGDGCSVAAFAVVSEIFSSPPMGMEAVVTAFIYEQAARVMALILRDGFHRLFVEFMRQNRAEFATDRFIQCLAFLPDRMLARIGSLEKIPESCLATGYFCALSAGTCDLLIGSTTFKDALPFVGALASKVVRVGQAANFADVIVLRLVHEHRAATNTFETFVRRLLEHTDEGAIEGLFEAVLNAFARSHCKDVKEAATIVGSILSGLLDNSVLLQHLCTNKFLTARPLVLPAMRVLVDGMALATGEAEPRSIVRAVLNTATLWGDPSFVKHADTRLHAYTSRVMLRCFPHVSKDELENASVMRSVMGGVTERLSSPLEPLRSLGMVVAEAITVCMDPTRPLKFEMQLDPEAVDVSKEVEQKELRSGPPPENPANIATPSASSSSASGAKAKKPVESDSEEDPDAPVTLGQIDKDDASSESSLEPLDLDEGEHAGPKDAKAPHYIRDYINIFRNHKPENADAVDAALGSILALIERDTVDLAENAAELCATLLSLPNAYNLEDYPRRRMNALVALAVHVPRPVAEFLCVNFYKADYGIGTRMDMLQILSKSARQLAQPPALPGESEPPPPLIKEIDTKDPRAVVQARIDAKTRRFIAPRKPVAAPSASKFDSATAGVYFFALMARYDDPQNTFKLMGEDSLLLGTLITTLGDIVYAASMGTAARRMARALVDFTVVFRGHPQANVRRATIYAIHWSLTSVSPMVAMSEFSDDFNELMAWTDGLASDDPDPLTRSLASSVVHLLRHIREETVRLSSS